MGLLLPAFMERDRVLGSGGGRLLFRELPSAEVPRLKAFAEGQNADVDWLLNPERFIQDRHGDHCVVAETPAGGIAGFATCFRSLNVAGPSGGWTVEYCCVFQYGYLAPAYRGLGFGRQFVKLRMEALVRDLDRIAAHVMRHPKHSLEARFTMDGVVPATRALASGARDRFVREVRKRFVGAEFSRAGAAEVQCMVPARAMLVASNPAAVDFLLAS